MTKYDPIMDPLRQQAQKTIASNALALGMGPASERDLPAGSYEVALGPIAKAGLKAAMHASGADAGFERTIGRMTGGQFSTPEIRSLEDSALTAAQPGDVGALMGIGEGPPVVLSPAQKAVVDRIMSGLGPDGLSNRARDAYQGAVRAGKVRVR